MSQPVQNALLQAIRDLNLAFDELGIRSVVIGGVAVSLLANPRHTDDIDTVILCDTDMAAAILNVLLQHGFRPRFADMEELARQARMVTVEHVGSGTVVDIALGCMPFEEEVERRSVLHRYGDLVVRLPSPEDLIILKAIANRPKDLDDIRNIVAVYPDIDRARIRRWVEEYAALLEAPELWRDIELLLTP
jgi:hypothetical protein